MTKINDFEFYVDYLNEAAIRPPFVPGISVNTQLFDFSALPAIFRIPQFDFNFNFWGNQNQSQNIFSTDFGTNTQKPLVQMPNFNVTNPTTNINQNYNFTSSGMFDTFTPSQISFTDMAAKTSSLAKTKPEVKMALGSYKPLKLEDYNASKGKKIADLAKEYTNYRVKKQGGEWVIDKSKRKPSVGKDSFTHQCARYVSIVIRDSGLGQYLHANGNQAAAKLRGNSNFKEISVNSTDWKHLPAGCILCYNAGSQGYDKKFGHVEITQENGTATSDGTTQNIRKPDAIFIPV